MKVAVVILNWNGRHYLERFLPSVLKYSCNAEVIVADNNSTDDSVIFLQNNFPSIAVIQLSKNEGFCTGYNCALQVIEADYFVLLNSDVEVTEGWMEGIINFMISNPEIAACQPKIKCYQRKNFFEYAGAAGGFIDYLGYPFCRGRIFETLEADKGQYNDLTEIFWATGACMFVKSSVFKEAGGFDDDFFAHMEEIDLCWRIKGLGYKIFYYGQSEVYHVGGGTLSKLNPYKTYLNFRNGLILIYKNLPEKDLFKIVFMRMILDGVAGLKFLMNGSIKHFWAVLQAHFYFYRNFKKLKKKRETTQNRRKVQTLNEILNKSLVWEYFIKKKKHFHQID